MRKKWYIILVSLLIVSACAETFKLSRNFTDVAPQLGNMVFLFKKDMVNDSMVRAWDTVQYIQFEPAIRGRFYWERKNQLVFSPYSKLKASTNYTATVINPKILESIEEPNFKFHTPFLKWEDASAYWAEKPSEALSAGLFLDLKFNYAIKPAYLLKSTKITIDGKEVTPVLQGLNKSKTIRMFLPGNISSQENHDIKIVLLKGFKFNDLRFENDVEKNIKSPTTNKLGVKKLHAFHDGISGTVSIFLSQTAIKKNIEKFITIKPKVKFTTTVSKDKILITSDEFDAKKNYEVIVKNGLLGILGGKLEYDYNENISFGILRPKIRFANAKGVYLSRNGNKFVDINLINVDKVTVRVYKVYKNNLISYIADDYSSFNRYDYDDYYYDKAPTPGRRGDNIFEKKYDTKDLPSVQNHKLLKLDFVDKIPDFKGTYVVEVFSEDEYWVRDLKVVSISDIGLIVKKGKKSVSVFANSIQDVRKLSGVTLEFIGKNNQVVGTAKTDSEGFAKFSPQKFGMENFDISLVTAQYGSDFTFIPLSKTVIGMSRYDVAGKTLTNSEIDAYIYFERDLYRPGETVSVSAILRDFQWKTPKAIPMKLKFVSPSGKELKTIRKKLNEFGSVETSLTLNKNAMTGSYSLEVYLANGAYLTSKSFAVEEFLPDRIKVDVKFDKKFLANGDEMKLDISAVNFFGPPAAGRNYKAEQSLRNKHFAPKGYSGYNFGIDGTHYYFDSEQSEGKTDAKGLATEKFTIDKDYYGRGVLQATYYVSVFDETGRSVSRKRSFDVYTQKYFFGVKNDKYYYPTDAKINFPIVAIDKDGKTVNNAKAKITIIKHDFKTVLSKSGNYFSYQSEEQEVVVKEKDVVINGNLNFDFLPTESGRYDIRVALPDIDSYVIQTFYVYGHGRTTYSSFKVNNEGQIDIETDKDKYKVGETANLILKAPFSGKILVTVENSEVIKHFYVNTDKRAAKITLKLEDLHVPNVYVTATLIKPHVNSDFPLTVAHGFVPVIVENPQNQIPVKIAATTSSKSRKTQKISIRTLPGAAVTVAVVDEGILQITNYKTPAPYNHFYGKRALAVKTHDIYPFLLPERMMTTGKPGGGGMLGMRGNPLENNRVNLVSFWSGILKADAAGNATYEIDIPQFSGDLRIMAVSYKDKRFGSSHSNMKVADDLVISPGIPRVLSPRDSVEIPVTVSNTTDNVADCAVEITVEGMLVVSGDAKKRVKIEANSEKRVKFRVRALPQIGESKISLKVNGLRQSFSHETDITVRPSSPLQKRSNSGRIDAGKTTEIVFDTKSFVKQSIAKKLVISNSPMVEFARDLDFLVQYPYGCLEQTVSKAFPQIYYYDLVYGLLNQKSKAQKSNPRHHVQEAIQKIKLMQLYNGGLTYWANSGSETWWGSVFAAHFLLEAKGAGYDVEVQLVKNLLDYLEHKLKEGNTETYYYNGDKKRTIAPKEAAYSMFVLALAGKAQISTMNYYKSNPNLLSLDAKYLLAAAYALSGDKDKYYDVLPKEFSGEVSVPQFGGSFYSPLRDEAIALYALQEVDPANGQVDVLAKHISQVLRTKKYLNTQERVFSFIALGKIAKQSAKSNIQAKISVDGKVVANYNNKAMTFNTKDLGGKVEIKTTGNGKLFYFWESEGISEDGSFKEEDNFLKVRRTYYDRRGNLVVSNKFKQNDLIVVRLTINTLQVSDIENVVISDIVPAGFEIVNIPDLQWIKKRSYPDYKDIRDDRVNIFVTATKKEKHYYYIARAVSPGVFHLGPIGADAMYNGEFHSYNGGGTVEIIER